MGLPRFERRIKVRGAKLAGQTHLTLPIKDHPLDLAGTEIWNRDGFFSSGNKTRVTVPMGYGGVYSVHAVVHWRIGDGKTFFPDIRDGNYFISQIAKNGSVSGDLREARSSDAPKIPATITRQGVFWEAELAESDFIEVLATCEVFDAATMTLFDGLYGVGWSFRLEHWFTIRRLGSLP
jgi:hypothetical protein